MCVLLPLLVRLSHRHPVGHDSVNTLWFAIFLQLFLILAVLYTLASDSIAMHRFQIAVFGAVAIVFAVQGVNQGIFVSNAGSLNAMSAGWLVLAFVDILWVLYFTSEEDSVMLYLFNSLGTGGLTPPGRRRRARPQSTIHSMAPNNGYATNYGSGIGSHDVPYDTKVGDVISQRSFAAPESPNDNSLANRSLGAGSLHVAAAPDLTLDASDDAPKLPLITGAGVGNASTSSGNDTTPQLDVYLYKAKAQYACMLFFLFRI